MRKAIFIAACAVLASISVAQTRQGIYRPLNSAGLAWSINEHHGLHWDGKPYIPVGVRLGPDLANLDAIKAAGIGDVIVELPANGVGWKDTISRLERAGMRYMIAITSIAPLATGVVVEPQGYRFVGITETKRIRFPLPGCQYAYMVLAIRSDGQIQKTGRVKIENGYFDQEITPPNDLDHVLLVYPETISAAYVDYWGGMDNHRDGILTALKTTPLGIGFRGIINPMGQTVKLKSERGLVPTSPLFRFELAQYLQERYRNFQTAVRSWSLSTHDLDTFNDLSRLVPLWSGNRGVGLLWDTVSNRTYACDNRKSTVWEDIEAVLRNSQSRRLQRLITAIKQVTDVPVIQEWAGWAPAYEMQAPALDGIGAVAEGTSPSQLANSVGGASSSILRWRQPGMFLLTDYNLDIDKEAPAALGLSLDDLASMGTCGWFVRSSNLSVIQTVGQEALKRSTDASVMQWSPKPLYYPESAHYPASSQRLPGGYWWLPAPLPGNRVDYGSEISGYRVEAPDGAFYVLWNRNGAKRIKIRFFDPKKPVFVTLDGSDPKPKIHRNAVELTLGETPILIRGTDEIPIPEPSLNELVFRMGQLSALAEGMRNDVHDIIFLFRDAYSGVDRNPGGSYTVMREQFNKLSLRLARYSWIEAESCKETNFSEAKSIPGTSNGLALSLQTQIVSPDAVYTAEYSLQARSLEDVDVWVSARIPRENRRDFSVDVGGQILRIHNEGLSPYNGGFIWYRMGTTKLARGVNKLLLEMRAPEGVDMAVDAILITQGGFAPRGPFIPDAIPFGPTPDKPLN
ncbi:MAG: hypothetical protein KF784_08035 [Fimbriimonadaceae bacterium]|nr:hypothetical protein [Fimbriimonadaceae bacterium]